MLCRNLQISFDDDWNICTSSFHLKFLDYITSFAVPIRVYQMYHLETQFSYMCLPVA